MRGLLRDWFATLATQLGFGELRRPGADDVVTLASALVLAGVMAAGVVVAGQRLLMTPELAAVRDVIVTGEQRTTRAEALAAAGLDRPRNVWTLRASELEAALDELPYVHSVGVRIDRVARMVTLDLVEAEPAAVAVDAGMPVLVSADGVRMGPWQGREADLPMLFGFETDRGEHAAQTVQEGLTWVEHARRAGFVQERAPREVHRLPGGTLRMVLADGLEVRLVTDRIEERLDRLRDVVRWSAREGRAVSYVVLDGRDLTRVTVGFADAGEAP